MSGAPTRVLLVDAAPIYRLGLAALLAPEPDLVTVGEAADVHEAEDALQRLAPDVALCPDLDTCRLADAAGVRAVVLGDWPPLEAALAGAAACLPRDVPPAELLGAIRAAARGEAVLAGMSLAALLAHVRARGLAEPPGRLDALSPRERDVLALVAEGRSNAQIGVALGLSAMTVKTYVSQLLKRLGAARRSEAAAIYARATAGL